MAGGVMLGGVLQLGVQIPALARLGLLAAHRAGLAGPDCGLGDPGVRRWEG
jgi:putative peptidoglycan lipid II flippase